MGKIPQKRHTTQAEEANIAHSASHTLSPSGGELVVGTEGELEGENALPKASAISPSVSPCIAQLSDEHTEHSAAPVEEYSQEYRRASDGNRAYSQEYLAQLEEALHSARRNTILLQESCSAKVAAAWERAEAAERRLAGSTDAWNKATREVAHLNKVVQRQAHEISEYKQMCGSAPVKDAHLLKRVEAVERQNENLRKWRDQLREGIDRATKQACDNLERAQKAEANAANLAAQVETLTAQLEENGAAQVEAQAARIAILEHDLAQARQYSQEYQAQAEHNARIAQEEVEAHRATLAENTELRGRLAELEDTGTEGADLRQQLTTALKRVKHLESLRQDELAYTARLECDEHWDEHSSANETFEQATKAVAKFMRKATQGKEGTFTPIYRDDVARATGMSEQAAGRHMNLAVASGLFSGYRTEEKATVPDARLGQRTITKKILNVAPTALLERPQDWKRGDGKEHGGARRYCKHCHAEDTLRTIPHTVCLACGAEDVWYPDDARIALDKTRAVEHEDAPAAVAEANWIVSQRPAPAAQDRPDVLDVQTEAAAPVDGPDVDASDAQNSAFQDEMQSQAPAKADPMALARAAGFPALALADHGVKIAAGSAAWSRWMHMSRPAPAAMSAVIAHFKGQPAPFDTICDYCGSAETVWDPDGSGRRVTACFVYPERRKPFEAPAQATPGHKVVDFASGGIVEVDG